MTIGDFVPVIIATDGACKGNPGVGGWGAVISYKDHVLEINGAEENTTNNRMELISAIKALQRLNKPCTVNLFTDSKYLQQGMTLWLPNWQRSNWTNSKKQTIKNIELWKELSELNQKHIISWHWVKGHNGHPDNEKADFLANEAIRIFLENKQNNLKF